MGELMGLFIITFGGIGAVLAYVIWRLISEALSASRQRRLAGESGQAATDEGINVPVAKPLSRLEMLVAAMTWALLIGGAIFWWNHGDESEPEPSRELTMMEQYPGPWREEFHLEITRALIANQVQGCGRYAFRTRHGSSGEYLVYCQGVTDSWRAYLVWPLTGKAIGPHAPDPTIPLPPK